MLLKTLKSNQTFHFLLIPLIAGALWIKSFLNPMPFPFYTGEDMMLLYQPINALIGKSTVASNIFALVFIILLAFLILKLNVQYTFIRVRTVLPSILFILITSGLHELHAMHPVYPAALFLILTVDRIFNAYDKEVIHSNAFEAGIFLAIGSLFYLNLAFFFPFLWIGFLIIKPKVNWREYILSTLGFILPWLAALAYYAGTGQSEDLIGVLKENISSHQSFLVANLPIQIYLGFLGFLTILASFLILSQYDGKKISSRKYFKAFFWIFLMSCILTIANPAVSQDIIILLAIPLTYLISNYLIYMKRPIWGEIYLSILIAGVIYLQFI
ncbi:MAG: DUF6427 family protein [Prolixibacteraceae bacterium]|nr:DUF6427 family protein [Prolixibacteraceae bacterium]